MYSNVVRLAAEKYPECFVKPEIVDVCCKAVPSAKDPSFAAFLQKNVRFETEASTSASAR
jgi:hypothetical protein